MGLRACILGSGSSGNCTFVASETTAILVDAGLSGRRTAERLAQVGACPTALQGICVSHEHLDHVGGVCVLHKRYGVPVYANAGTVDALARVPKLGALPWNLFHTGHSFVIGDLRIEPFSVPHDAYDPVGFVVEQNDNRIGIVTDMGMCTSLIRERLRRCHAVVVEANHDEQLLQNALRPWALKQRIRGRQGHLSNQSAAALLVEIAGPELRHVFLAHLSEDCNRQDLALAAIQAALTGAGHAHISVSLTFPDRVSEVWTCV